ncbi:MAG: bifunctional DNA primase/polymerase, partial [Candidatus Aenigmatarchaeota archaeon]
MLPLEAALEFAGNGWPVIPVHTIDSRGNCSCKNPHCTAPGKHPATPHGYRDATVDAERIKRLFENRDWNIGIATGERFCALDLDDNSEAAWVALDQLTGGIPNTMIARTRRGFHFYFSVEEGLVPSRVLSNNPRIELIGLGRFVIVPPSQYKEWLNYVEPRPIPERILKIPPVREQRSKIEQVIRGVPEGFRNVTATQVAGKLLGCFPTEDWHIAWILLEAWNEKNRPPLSKKELKTVFDKIAKREMKKGLKHKERETKLARALAIALHYSNLSQRELARLSHVPQATLSRL